MQVDDTATKWGFDCLTDASGNLPPDGIVLQNMQHDSHNFAKDVRLIGLWVETETVDPSGPVSKPNKQFFSLSSFKSTAVRVLTPKTTANPSPAGGTFQYLREADAALSFSQYFKEKGNYVGCGVTASFIGSGFFNRFANCEYADLNINEIFLCSPRTNHPPHEPSGALLAARFFPLVQYELTPNPKLDERSPLTRLRSLRFDYRLQLYIDRHHDLPTNAALTQLGNQAGLFADSDSSTRTALSGIVPAIKSVFASGAHVTLTGGAFIAIEKPLVLEVMAPALGAGFPVFEVTGKDGKKATVRCWDNVHWWGARGLASGAVISAPGAFHCAHLHWRWGGAASAGAASVSTNPAFDPTTWPRGMSRPPGVSSDMWGPLLDPGVWMQTLRVAVSLNDKSLDPAFGATAATMTRNDWESMFTGLRSKPEPIGSGADIVLWFSTDVSQYIRIGSGTAAQTYQAAPKATLFIHGLFFAHDAEVSSFFVGSTNPAFWPTSEADIKKAGNWARNAT
jgi:hypothetical protein